TLRTWTVIAVRADGRLVVRDDGSQQRDPRASVQASPPDRAGSSRDRDHVPDDRVVDERGDVGIHLDTGTHRKRRTPRLRGYRRGSVQGDGRVLDGVGPARGDGDAPAENRGLLGRGGLREERVSRDG